MAGYRGAKKRCFCRMKTCYEMNNYAWRLFLYKNFPLPVFFNKFDIQLQLYFESAAAYHIIILFIFCKGDKPDGFMPLQSQF